MSELDRLRWRCRRGMLELDLVLTAFLDRHYALLGAEEIGHFAQLLELPDNELWDFISGGSVPRNPQWAALVQKLGSS